MKTIIASLLIFLPTQILLAFAADSTKDTTTHRSFNEQQFGLGEFHADSGVYYLDHFHSYDPALPFNGFNYHLGNIGLATHSFTFEPSLKTGFDIGRNAFNQYLYSNDQVRYFNTPKPYTDLFFVLGTENEQFFEGIHTQNVNPNFNFGLKGRKILSKGFYSGQKSNITNFCAFASFKSDSSRYALLANFIFNKVVANENGGLTNDSLFLSDTIVNTEFFEVNLPAPLGDNYPSNNYNEKSVFIKQFYYLGEKIETENDSASTIKIFPSSFFSHSFGFREQNFVYKEATTNTNFYGQWLIDSAKTNDSSFFRTFTNTFQWSLAQYNSKQEARKIIFSAHLTHQYFFLSNSFSQNLLIGSNQNLIVGANLRGGTTATRFLWDLNGNYILKRLYYNNQGDYNLEGTFGYLLGSSGTPFAFLKLDLNYILSSPSDFQNYYFSNYFHWRNHFEQVKTLSGRLSIDLKKYRTYFSVSGIQVNGYIYFDEQARPRQMNSNISGINILMLNLRKEFKLGNWFWDNNILYQKKLTEEKVVNIPEFLIKSSLYYENNFFRKALLLRFGCDFLYFSQFTADAYMPATAQFYLQNEVEAGNYPYLDLFASFRIKTARIFIKSEHISQLLYPKNKGYYITPYYPQAGTSFKLGISWIFFN